MNKACADPVTGADGMRKNVAVDDGPWGGIDGPGG